MPNPTHKPPEQLASDLEAAKEQVPIGSEWAHYKTQNLYKIIGHVIDADLDEAGVIYQAQYGDHLPWFHTLSAWMETVEWEGKKVRRFTKVD